METEITKASGISITGFPAEIDMIGIICINDMIRK
jgi:hypothetical protein